jgi:hypothetical protein
MLGRRVTMRGRLFGIQMLICLFFGPIPLVAQSIAPRWDVGTYCCGCTSSNQDFCDIHFDHLNYTTQAHHLAMGFDTQRTMIVANHNALAIYHNDLNTSYTYKTPAQKAAEVQSYALSRFATNGARPDWIVMNEISAGLWPGTATYRTWVIDLMTSLTQNYNFKVILLSPFSNPGGNDASWQAVAARGVYIGVENYLSGEEVKNQGYSVSWCQSQCQSSKNSYLARGVPAPQIFLIEHFGQTVAGTGWGRAGLSLADWDHVILTRGQAIQNVGFAGFLTYSWGGNGMGTSRDDMAHFEDTYASQAMPTVASDVAEWGEF